MGHTQKVIYIMMLSQERGCHGSLPHYSQVEGAWRKAAPPYQGCSPANHHNRTTPPGSHRGTLAAGELVHLQTLAQPPVLPLRVLYKTLLPAEPPAQQSYAMTTLDSSNVISWGLCCL
jgi:hypothetical protein